MVADFTPATEVTDTLLPEHYSYFYDRAFTFAHMPQIKAWGVRSITKREALGMGIKKYDPDRKEHLSDGGIWLPFTDAYGQIRFNTPLKLQSGKEFKYLSPATPARAWIPPGGQGITSCSAITEGWADAAAPTVRGVRTAAIVGTYNVIYSIDRGCKVPIIFDSDGWQKPQVMRALLLAAIWTEGKINLFPQMESYPSGGGSEFFKVGHTPADYQQLINDAMKPAALIEAWLGHWKVMDRNTATKAAWVATEALQWLRQPDVVAEYLQQCRDAKIPPDKGLSAVHQERHHDFLNDAVEVAV
jgi:hypothetical protein